MAAENTTQILQENDTCWRVARCGRARVLIDAADYFLAVRRAFLKARHSIFIVGWDIDSRTRLLGAGGEAEKDDDLPVELCALLPALVKRRPELKIHLLLWDYSLLYALASEPFAALKLGRTHPHHARVSRQYG